MEKHFETHIVLTKQDVHEMVAKALGIDINELSFNDQIVDTTPEYYGGGSPSYGFGGIKVIHKRKA